MKTALAALAALATYAALLAFSISVCRGWVCRRMSRRRFGEIEKIER